MQTRPMCIANSSNQHHKYLSGRTLTYIGCDGIATQEERTNANLSNEYCKFMQPTQKYMFLGKSG